MDPQAKTKKWYLFPKKNAYNTKKAVEMASGIIENWKEGGEETHHHT